MAATDIERECRVFTRYLAGCAPSTYVTRKYVEAHHLPAYSNGNRFDHYLLRVATRSARLTRTADSYARFFCSNALLRRKLILLLAILETSASCSIVDPIEGVGLPTLIWRLVAAGVRSVVSLAAGVIVFLPAHLLLSRGEPSTG